MSNLLVSFRIKPYYFWAIIDDANGDGDDDDDEDDEKC